jgi:hypothetical protein
MEERRKTEEGDEEKLKQSNDTTAQLFENHILFDFLFGRVWQNFSLVPNS